MLLLASAFLYTNILAISETQYKLVWSDEFNGRGRPDPKKWDYEYGKVRNNEPQFYTRNRRENSRVEGGNLVLEARKEEFEGSHYTGASLITLNKFHFQYGKVEVRAKLPGGMGTWPAIWMMGADRPQVGWPRCAEVDIMEHIAYEPSTIFGTLHQISPDGKGHVSKGGTTKIPDATEQFHVYGLEWTPKAMKMMVDDNVYFEYPYQGPTSWTFDRPMYLLINFAIGGAWAGKNGIDDSCFPQKFLIDYVRVYQRS